MTEYVESQRVIHRVLAANANDALIQRLDAFEDTPRDHHEHTLRTLGAKSIILTTAADRDEYATGQGLRLKRYERSLQVVAPPHQLKLDPKIGLMRLNEGALLRIHLDLSTTEEPIVNAGPLFENDERIALHYFIARSRLIGGDALKKAGVSLQQSIADGESRVQRPRVIEPTLNDWSPTFTPYRNPSSKTRAA